MPTSGERSGRRPPCTAARGVPGVGEPDATFSWPSRYSATFWAFSLCRSIRRCSVSKALQEQPRVDRRDRGSVLRSEQRTVRARMMYARPRRLGQVTPWYAASGCVKARGTARRAATSRTSPARCHRSRCRGRRCTFGRRVRSRRRRGRTGGAKERRRRGVVDDQRQPLRVAPRRGRPEVDDVDLGLPSGLGEDRDWSSRRRRRPDPSGFSGSTKRTSMPNCGRCVREERVGPAVQRGQGDDVVAGEESG